MRTLGMYDERGAGARTVHAWVDHHQTFRHGRIVVRVAAPPAARRGLHGDQPKTRATGAAFPHARAMIRSSPTGSEAPGQLLAALPQP